MNDRDVVEVFHRFADGPEPPLGIDVHAAASDGRRLARRRSLLHAGTAGLAVAAVLATAAVVLRVGPGSGRVAAPTPVVGGLSAAPAEFDPLVARGRMPEVAGMPRRLVMLSRGMQRYVAALSGTTGAGLTGVAWDLYPTAHPPQAIGTGRMRAPDVQGRPAWWWCQGKSGSAACTALVWQWADGAWAVVHPVATGLVSPGVAQALDARVAAGIRLVTSRQRLAFTLAALPPSFSVVTTLLLTEPGRWSSKVELSDFGAGAVPAGSPRLSITASNYPQAARVQTNTVVDQHPAYQSFGNDSALLIVPIDSRANVVVTADHNLERLHGIDGLAAVYRSVQTVPDPADVTSWPTRLVR